MKPILFRSLIVVAVLAGAFLFWRNLPDQPVKDHFSGYAEGELVYVSSPLGGQLQALNVQRGDQAQAGKTLFQLEHAEELAARAEAEEMLRESRTRYDKAKMDFDRAKSLRDKRVTAPEDYDAAAQTLLSMQHTVAARQRGLEQADWRHNQKSQAATIGGLVYDTYFRPGEWVPAGKPVLSLLPPEYIKARFFVPAADLGAVQVGRPLEIRMDGLTESLPARVSFVSPAAEYTLPIIYSRENRNKLVYLVEATLPPEAARKLHPGAPIEASLAQEKKP